MKTAHSPAPWFVAAHTAESPDEITPGCDWTVYGADKVSVCFEGAYNKHANANVRLITAAPDLLEACLTLLAWDEAENNAEAFDKDQGKAWRERQALCAASFDKARAAVAKATRGQS